MPEEEKTIIDNEVVITTKVSLQEFIKQKQQEIEMIQQEVVSGNARIALILDELSKLVDETKL